MIKVDDLPFKYNKNPFISYISFTVGQMKGFCIFSHPSCTGKSFSIKIFTRLLTRYNKSFIIYGGRS